MNEKESILFAVFMAIAMVALFPTLIYMHDKINLHGPRKFRGHALWSVWPCVPFVYIAVWHRNRNDCRAFPMVLWVVLMIAIVATLIVLTVFEVIGNK